MSLFHFFSVQKLSMAKLANKNSCFLRFKRVMYTGEKYQGKSESFRFLSPSLYLPLPFSLPSPHSLSSSFFYSFYNFSHISLSVKVTISIYIVYSRYLLQLTGDHQKTRVKIIIVFLYVLPLSYRPMLSTSSPYVPVQPLCPCSLYAYRLKISCVGTVGKGRYLTHNE